MPIRTVHSLCLTLSFFLFACGGVESKRERTSPQATPSWVKNTPALCVVKIRPTSKDTGTPKAVSAAGHDESLVQRLESALRQYLADYRNEGGIVHARFREDVSIASALKEVGPSLQDDPRYQREALLNRHSYRLSCLEAQSLKAAINAFGELTKTQRAAYIRRVETAFEDLEESLRGKGALDTPSSSGP